MKRIPKFLDPANYYNSEERHSWVKTLFSLTLVAASAQVPLIQSQLLREQGISGIWLVACSLLGSGLLIFFFSELWQRSGLKNDNNYVYVRFNPRPAKVLNRFRGIYVGGIVFPIISAMMLVSFAKFTSVYWDLSYEISLAICTAITFLSTLLLGYNVKVHRDYWLVWLFLTGWIGLTIYSGNVILSSDITLNERFQELNVSTSLWGEGDLTQMLNVVMYIGILWWSKTILDGSGSSAQRFINTDSMSGAKRSAMISGILIVIVNGGFLLINIAALSNTHVDPEMGFIQFLLNDLPPFFSFMAYIVMALALLTTVEGFLNTGGSYIFDRSKASGNQEKRFKKRHHPLLTVAGLLTVTLIISLIYQSVTQILFLLLAMGAGVGPVFILRWFWMRVNAWSQLSAMLSSLILAVSFDLAQAHLSGFDTFLTQIEQTRHISPFAVKFISITILVTIIWLTVTYLTKPVDEQIIKDYKKRFGFGDAEESNPFKSPKRWLKAIAFGVVMSAGYFWGYWLVLGTGN